jgi:hypothetical protein
MSASPEEFYKSGQVILDAGLDLETKSMRSVKGKVAVTDVPLFEAKEIGSAFLIEARDMEERFGSPPCIRQRKWGRRESRLGNSDPPDLLKGVVGLLLIQGGSHIIIRNALMSISSVLFTRHFWKQKGVFVNQVRALINRFFLTKYIDQEF